LLFITIKQITAIIGQQTTANSKRET